MFDDTAEIRRAYSIYIIYLPKYGPINHESLHMNPLWIPYESPMNPLSSRHFGWSLLVLSLCHHGASCTARRPGGSWSLDGRHRQFMDKSHGKFTGVNAATRWRSSWLKSPCHHHRRLPGFRDEPQGMSLTLGRSAHLLGHRFGWDDLDNSRSTLLLKAFCCIIHTYIILYTYILHISYIHIYIYRLHSRVTRFNCVWPRHLILQDGSEVTDRCSTSAPARNIRYSDVRRES